MTDSWAVGTVAAEKMALPTTEDNLPRRWRIGQSVGRTIYVQLLSQPTKQDTLIGVMDTPELACTVVDAVNAAMVPVATELSVNSAERAAMDALRERDEYHEVADQLAAAISRLTCVDIGEHSSGNDPWRNALAAAEVLVLEAVKDVMSSPEIVTLSQADYDLVAKATNTVLAGREVVTPTADVESSGYAP